MSSVSAALLPTGAPLRPDTIGAGRPAVLGATSRTIRLRKWQKNALDVFASRDGDDFLAVATPGAGKTTFALTAARQDLAAHPGRSLVVVAPTQHLKGQWAVAAEHFGLHLDPAWIAGEPLPAEVHGIVTTYQQVAQSTLAIRTIANGAFVVLDEIHHAGDERAWGDGVRSAFEVASVRLCLSGTLFRSDSRAIPFVYYDAGGEAEPDVEYGYGPALADRGVVRPVHFPRLGGEMEWIGPDGSTQSASFDDALDPRLASQRLRTALDASGEWMPDALARAHAQLADVRQTHPEAGGLVIAMDRDHARGWPRSSGTGWEGRGGDQRRPHCIAAHLSIRHEPRSVAGGCAHGERGGRHPAPSCGCVRDHHDDRSLLPPGRWAHRALDPGARPPAVVHVHAR